MVALIALLAVFGCTEAPLKPETARDRLEQQSLAYSQASFFAAGRRPGDGSPLHRGWDGCEHPVY